MDETLLYGRQTIAKRGDTFLETIKHIKKEPCIIDDKDKQYCQRCHATIQYKEFCARCKKTCAYCHDCLMMGKITECSELVWLDEPKTTSREVEFTFHNQLSSEQKRASDGIIEAIIHHTKLLIAAVTGAGKTEMIFNGVSYALSLGYRVCICAPRIDVCLELAPRLQAVFPKEDIAVLYGKSSESYHYTKLVIATTHQLLKFKEAFDVLIIDEVDAFPFSNNRQLEYRVSLSMKKRATLILLTATPNENQLNAIKKGEIQRLDIPVRFHGYPLPLPRFMWIGDWQKKIRQKKTLKQLIRLLLLSVENKRVCLVFLPSIQLMLALEEQLRAVLPETIIFTSVSSIDVERIDKINHMRAKRYDFLLTTTILERGVTFANIDVIVLGAENKLFTMSALVQICGRVGRKAEYPNGSIIFLHHGVTKAMKNAKKYMASLNQCARERGLLR